MISVVLTCDTDGKLLQVSAEGHAQAGSFGNDTVCAAVSFLLRTVALSLGETCKIQAKKRGSLFLVVKRHTDMSLVGDVKSTVHIEDMGTQATKNKKDLSELFTLYAAHLLQVGFSSLVAEYPDKVCFKKVIQV